MLRLREPLRCSLNKTVTLDYLLNIIKRRTSGVSQETQDEIRSELVCYMLEHEQYYEQDFNSGFAAYCNLALTAVLAEFARSPSTLDNAWSLDQPVCQEGEDMSGYDVMDPGLSLTESQRVFTRTGWADEMTYYLSQLTDIQSDVFALKAVYGNTTQEVADLLGYTYKYTEHVYADAKIALAQAISNEEAYMAQQMIGDVSGRIITNNAGDTDVWNDWSWRESNAEPGPVKQYSRSDIGAYCTERGIEINLQLNS